MKEFINQAIATFRWWYFHNRPLSTIVVFVASVMAGMILTLLLVGCSSPRVQTFERRDYYPPAASNSSSVTANPQPALRREIKRGITEAPRNSEQPSSLHSTRDGIGGVVGAGSNDPKPDPNSRDWIWTTVLCVIGAGFIGWSYFLIKRGGWITVSIYPAAAGIGIIILAVTLNKFAWLYTALLLGGAIIGVALLVWHFRYVWNKAASQRDAAPPPAA